MLAPPCAADSANVEAKDQAWYTPLLVFCLVSIALLAGLADRRDLVQTFGAILAVFFGAATILRTEFGPWFRGNGGMSDRAMEFSLTGCGVLVIGVGAAFLLT
jgi:hypothetical protein